MTTPRDPDEILVAWLEEGPTQLPETTRRAIAVATRTTRQSRRAIDVPWRMRPVNLIPRLAVAVAAVVIVAGGAFVLLPRNEGVGGPEANPTSPSTTPPGSPTVSPSPSRTTIDRTAEAGYMFTIPATWHSRIVETGVNTGAGIQLSLPAPLSAGSVTEGGVEAVSDPPVFAIGLGTGTGGTYALRGHDLAELLASLDAFYATNYSTHPEVPRQVSVDGELAWIVETRVDGPAAIWVDALAIHGDMALYVSLSAPPENAAAVRSAVDELLASMRWTD